MIPGDHSGSRLVAIACVGFVALSIPAGVTTVLAIEDPVQSDRYENAAAGTLPTAETSNVDSNMTGFLDTSAPPTTTVGPAQTERASKVDGYDSPHTTALSRKIPTSGLLQTHPNTTNERIFTVASDTLELSQRRLSNTDEVKKSAATIHHSNYRGRLHGARILLRSTDSHATGYKYAKAVRLAKRTMNVRVGEMEEDTTTQSALPSVPKPSHDSASSAAFALVNHHDYDPTPKEAAKIRALNDLPRPTRTALKEYLNAYIGYEQAVYRAFADANVTKLKAIQNRSSERAWTRKNATLSYGMGKSRTSTRTRQASSRNASISPSELVGLQEAGVNVPLIIAARQDLLESTLALKRAMRNESASGLEIAGNTPQSRLDTEERKRSYETGETFSTRTLGVTSPNESVLETVRRNLADEATNPGMQQRFGKLQTNFRGARKLYTRTEGKGIDNSSRAVRLAVKGTHLQAAQGISREHDTDSSQVGLPSSPGPDHDSPSAAAFYLLATYGETPTAEEAESIHRLDNLPEPARSDLTEYIDAFIAVRQTSLAAYADANLTELQSMSIEPSVARVSRETASHTSLHTASGDVQRVLSARIRLIRASAELRRSVPRSKNGGISTASTHSVPGERIHVDGVVSISLGDHNNTYQDDYALLVDVAGDDTYNNNAGGGRGGPPDPRNGVGSGSTAFVAALVDFNGNDVYNGQNGGGNAGVGFLLDSSGNDAYTAGGKGTNGGGYAGGLGFLIDIGGSDTFNAGGFGTNGGGERGMGFLLNTGGGDTYTAMCCGTNGGAIFESSSGFLLDIGGGNDTYVAAGGSAGGCCGTNGGSEGGVGFLMDIGGDDTFRVSDPAPNPRGVNGGALRGVGTLVNVGGDDEYAVANANSPGSSTSNGGASTGIGMLLDVCGNDRYNENRDETIAPKGSVGVQADAFSGDVCPTGPSQTTTPSQTPTPTATPSPSESATPTQTPTPSPSPTPGQLQIGNVLSIDLRQVDSTYKKDFAALIDAGGDDEYRNNAGGGSGGLPSVPDPRGGVKPGSGSIPIGVLTDLRGDDEYYGRNGGGYKGVGFLLDVSGNDTYKTGSTGTNGGGYLGVGFLLDANGSDTYDAGSGGTNGGGRSGLGLLVDAGGSDTYDAHNRGTNGGGRYGGQGTLVDGSGNDVYRAGDGGTNGGSDGGNTTGNGPSGFLLDGGGNDRYTAGSAGTNGGGNKGKGFLLDSGGNDVYHAGFAGTNGGGRLGTGFLLDTTGNDTYIASEFGTNGGGQGGVGVLVDGGGTDRYNYKLDDFFVRPKGIVGFQVDLPGPSNRPTVSLTPTPKQTPSPTKTRETNPRGDTLHVEGTCDRYDEDGTTGSDEDTDGDSTYGSIQAAETAANPADTIVVYTCEYNESVTIDEKNLAVRANGEPILTGRGRSNSAFTIVAPDVMISGFEIRNYSSSAITVSGTGSVDIENNEIRNTSGITVENATGVDISHNSIVASADRSISVRGGRDIRIRSNDVDNTITVVSAPGTVITNNTVTNVSGNRLVGIDISAWGTLVQDNIINDRSIFIGINVVSARNVSVIGNTIPKGNGHTAGIVVTNATNTTVNMNRIDIGFFHYTTGIAVQGSHQTDIQINTVSNAEIGIDDAGMYCSDRLFAPTESPSISCSTMSQPRSTSSTIRSNTVKSNTVGISVHFAADTLVKNNVVPDNEYGIRIHDEGGTAVNVTIESNRIRNNRVSIAVVGGDDTGPVVNTSVKANQIGKARTGIILAGANDTTITSNLVQNTRTGIWTSPPMQPHQEETCEEGDPTDDKDPRDEIDIGSNGPRVGAECTQSSVDTTKGNFQTTGTVITENEIMESRNGTVVDTGSVPRLMNNRFSRNRIAVRVKEAVNPGRIAVRHNHFQGNIAYSIFNGNDNIVLNASANEWAGGLPASPPNNSNDNPIQDPYSGVLANGSGGAVSEGSVPGVSNVHFCEESRSHCLDPPIVDGLSGHEAETTSSAAEFDVDWAVRDEGENLESVELQLVDDTDGETEETVSVDVSGGNASKTTRLVAPREDGLGHTYKVKLTVTDSYGSTGSDTIDVSETEPQTLTATATPTPTPTQSIKVTNGTGGGSGTGPGGSGAGGSGGRGGKSTSGASSDATSQKSTTGDEKQTVTQTPPATPTETPTETQQVTPTPEVIPGFGVVVWIAAFVLLVGLLARRRRA